MSYLSLLYAKHSTGFSILKDQTFGFICLKLTYSLLKSSIYIWEKAMAPHSSTLAWKIPWMEEPGRLQFMGSLQVRHD